MKEIDEDITDHKSDLDWILLYRNERYRHDTNKILLSTAKFCIDSKRFDLSLFYFCFLV